MSLKKGWARQQLWGFCIISFFSMEVTTDYCCKYSFLCDSMLDPVRLTFRFQLGPGCLLMAHKFYPSAGNLSFITQSKPLTFEEFTLLVLSEM